LKAITTTKIPKFGASELLQAEQFLVIIKWNLDDELGESAIGTPTFTFDDGERSGAMIAQIKLSVFCYVGSKTAVSKRS